MKREGKLTSVISLADLHIKHFNWSFLKFQYFSTTERHGKNWDHNEQNTWKFYTSLTRADKATPNFVFTHPFQLWVKREQVYGPRVMNQSKKYIKLYKIITIYEWYKILFPLEVVSIE